MNMGFHCGVFSQKSSVFFFQLVSAYLLLPLFHVISPYIFRLQKCIGSGCLKKIGNDKKDAIFIEKIKIGHIEFPNSNEITDNKCQESEGGSEVLGFPRTGKAVFWEKYVHRNLEGKIGKGIKINLEPKDDASKVGALWEHQELIDQLEMEVGRGRRPSSNLGTISEESEEKLEHERCGGELQKSHQIYTQKMRKWDVLNYQKLYALGFLEQKDPFQSSRHPNKPLAPMLKPFILHNLWPSKNKSRAMHPMKKLIHELHGDLEHVYVGQMCLSWEFLRFQYNEVSDLRSCDPWGVYHYNEAAIEFQQFQALMQRFIMDKHGQGWSRVQNYVKNRCVLHNLLQVPLVKGGEYLKKKKRKKETMVGKKDFTSEMLVEIIQNSIQTFHQFVQSDDDCNTLSIHGHKKVPHLHNSQDLELFLQVKKILQRKEKMAKDTARGENRISRKLRQNRGDDVDRFVAQVDMKLVSRVVSMSRITRDQLLWCGNKLSKISFVNGSICVEGRGGFSLFPCTIS